MTGLLIYAGILLGLIGFGVLISLHARNRLADIQGVPRELVTTRRNLSIPKPLLKAAQKVAMEESLPPDVPPLDIGDECLLLGEITLKSVGVMTVVDCNDTDVVVAWDDGNQETKLSREIVRRHRPKDLTRKTVKPLPHLVTS